MKICQIIPSLEERYGGPSKSVRAMSEALAREGHPVELLTTRIDGTRAGEVENEGSLRVVTFGREWPTRLCPSAGMRRALRGSEAEIVHHHSLWLRTLHYAHAAARRHRAQLVLSPRGMMSAWAWKYHSLRKRLARALVHPGALEAVAGWHATSAEEEQDIRALGFKEPVCVSPNGVAAPSEAERVFAAEHWHEACPATQSRPTAVFYSRLHQKKRVLELIDTWLEHTPREWVLLIVGIPQDYTPAVLERYAFRTSGRGRVFAFSGAGRPAPYAVASLFVLPSHSENFGLVIAEAMAHGVPAVVTDTTPWSAISRAGLGWCVPWPDYGAALRAATSESAATLRDRGARAKDWVLREFSWERAARTLLEFYAALRGAA